MKKFLLIALVAGVGIFCYKTWNTLYGVTDRNPGGTTWEMKGPIGAIRYWWYERTHP